MARRTLGSVARSIFRSLVDDKTPVLGGDLGLGGFNIDFPTTANISDCLDENDMNTDSATMLATQQSIKAYADSLVVAQANQAAMEAETDQNTYVPPDLIKHSPGVGKVWGHVVRSDTPTLSSPDHNVTSATDDIEGTTIITIATDFSTAVYAVGATALVADRSLACHTLAAGSYKVLTLTANAGGAADDTDFTTWAFGDQA